MSEKMLVVMFQQFYACSKVLLVRDATFLL